MKYKLSASLMIAGLLLAGCGDDDAKQSSTTKTENTASEKTEKVASVDSRLKEPSKDEKCAFCNMKVHAKDDNLGAFTAQAIDENGKNLFFDDAGCMLNYEREHKVTLEKFVRDYDSKEWIQLEDATVVKGDIKTPMNYGFAYFTKSTDAEQFVDENKGAKIVAVADIDDVAHEKMKMMHKDGESHSEHKHMDDEDSESMDMD